MKLVLILLAVALASPAFAITVYSAYEPALVPGFTAPYYADTLEPYPYVIGRQGIGFDKRTALANGFRVPLTPQILEVLRKYPVEKIGEPSLFTKRIKTNTME
ncbi:uncharacterized protein [Choristoneura fumiferana]|uniref:uncharacterized protein n=1 Tax=Choristoneura fumiferana TaxID=7141 RepID=UPI003D159180